MPESRRTVISALEHLVESGSKKVKVRTFQKRPNTFAVARYSDYVGFGFSKVCYPDTWDEEKGREVAIHKAVQDLGNKFWEGEEQFNLLVQERREYS